MWMRIKSWLWGELVGIDQRGNCYYQTRHQKDLWSIIQNWFNSSPKRWVVYKDKPDPTGIPANWHGWLHYTTLTPPQTEENQHSWQKEPLVNMTGTAQAYKPGGSSAQISATYEAWIPKEEE
jgi:NADH:ubiquinone oxidoreductase subunit